MIEVEGRPAKSSDKDWNDKDWCSTATAKQKGSSRGPNMCAKGEHVNLPYLQMHALQDLVNSSALEQGRRWHVPRYVSAVQNLTHPK